MSIGGNFYVGFAVNYSPELRFPFAGHPRVLLLHNSGSRPVYTLSVPTLLVSVSLCEFRVGERPASFPALLFGYTGGVAACDIDEALGGDVLDVVHLFYSYAFPSHFVRNGRCGTGPEEEVNY